MARIRHLPLVSWPCPPSSVRFSRARFLGALFLLGAIAACASTGSGGHPLLVTLVDYRNGGHFELASESHTDRVEYYSKPRDDAARKIQTDEVMSGLLRELERLGLGEHARTGPAPGSAPEAARWALEIDSGERQLHWLIGSGSPAPEWQDFQNCRDTFLALYNRTISYQTVENESGKEFFEGSAPRAGTEKPAR